MRNNELGRDSGRKRPYLNQATGRLGSMTMTTKEIAVKSIEEMPETANWYDIEERIHFLAAIEKGLNDIRAGRLVPHEDVTASLEKWLSE